MVGILLLHERYSWFYNIPITDSILRALIHLPEVKDDRYYAMIDNVFIKPANEDMIFAASLAHGINEPYIMAAQLILGTAKTGVDVDKYLRYYPKEFSTELDKQYGIYLVNSLKELGKSGSELQKLANALE